MKVECPRCHTHVEKPLHGDPICPTCGFGAPEGAAGTTPPSPAPGAPAAPGLSAAPEAAAQPPRDPAEQPPRDPASPAGLGTAATAPAWEHTGAPASAPKQGLAITALVLGILGCCTFFPLFGIAGIVFGAIALKKIKEEPQTYGGHGMALTGLILGIIGAVIGVIVLIFYGVLIAAIFDCEENPDSEFCQGLEEGSNEPARAGPLTVPGAFLATFAVPRRAWHAG